ncbi:glutaredoxin domain-containing protein [Diaphorobacter sp.]|uniref:glutaredoxin domain-containing protein n=1 Tax=Diaphorobacter sp. TaxID=1934310 RepID=UPI003D106746
MSILRTAAALAATCAAATVLPPAAQAQHVYRIVGPDGKVTFSDRAPAAGAEGKVISGGPRSASGLETLPYQLRQTATRFPVTLYTSSDCVPCNSARNLLVNRGIPFTERTITSNEDLDALKRLSGVTSVPFGTIGAQHLQGFSDAQWTQYLDAAGYPQQSQLPRNYQAPAPTPLVSGKPPTPAAEPAPPPRPAAPPVVDGPTPNNPAGIRF